MRLAAIARVAANGHIYRQMITTVGEKAHCRRLTSHLVGHTWLLTSDGPNPGPDEEGIETLVGSGVTVSVTSPNPGPDEEGIETNGSPGGAYRTLVRTQAPMKRGLKLNPLLLYLTTTTSEPRPR